MLTLPDDPDPVMVETLVKAAAGGMARATVPDVTTQSEIVSAVFTLLDRTLRSMRRLQDVDERQLHALQYKKALEDLILDHGHLPS